MGTWVILASGHSLTPQAVEYVRVKREAGLVSGVIAVSDVGILLAPWADALVSHDSRWWACHPEALEFKGRKFCRSHWQKCEYFVPKPHNGCNSGYMAMQVAQDVFDATKIILLGFDMHGTHFFGKHEHNLKNTTHERFQVHLAQFNGWDGCDVINCTPDSSLKKFPLMPLEMAI